MYKYLVFIIVRNIFEIVGSSVCFVMIYYISFIALSLPLIDRCCAIAYMYVVVYFHAVEESRLEALSLNYNFFTCIEKSRKYYLKKNVERNNNNFSLCYI